MVGAVIDVASSGPEARYTVLLKGTPRSFFASQLVADEPVHAQRPRLDAEACKALLSARYINHPSTSALYSLNAARIDFIPYQFRPVIKFIRADRPRLLIADGVGVGKTIEAGLILKELQARQEVASVLIICPRPLVTEQKWQKEMKRFDQAFQHLDSKTLRHCISEYDLEGEWPANYRFGIIPYSILGQEVLLGRDGGPRSSSPCLLDLDPPPRFDLVIVDEAHRVANPETYGHRIVQYLCDNADAVVFLSATPLQLGNGDLFSLLNLLRPDLVIDRQSFDFMSEPNPPINAAATSVRRAAGAWPAEALAQLEKAEATPWGTRMLRANPELTEIKACLRESSVSEADRIALVERIESLHTFSGIINRTRRRDIGAFTIRRSETVEIPFTAQQRQLHDALLSVQAEILSSLHGSYCVKFMMSTIRRQAASCLFGLAPHIEAVLSRHLSPEELSELDSDDLDVDPAEFGTFAAKVKAVAAMARTLDPADPKLDALLRIVQQKRAEGRNGNRRIMLFSSFRFTLQYLHENLRSAGVRVGLVHGGVPDEERNALRRRFEMEDGDPEAVDVLLFSEVGCEGLDYQFCDCMVNYDLPWNPMRVEQRIGRIDRNGQKSEFVSIYNFITPGTVDADIYQRCLLRIGVFEQSLGGTEDILGRVTNDIQAIAFDAGLTEVERQEKLQQLADNEIRQIKEEEKLETQQSGFFGIEVPSQKKFSDDVAKASSHWLRPEALQLLVAQYLQGLGKSASVLGESSLRTLRASQEVRQLLLADFRRLPGKAGTACREWEKWLKGDDPHLAVTFDGHCASEHRSAHLLTPLHPLVRQAAAILDETVEAEVSLQVHSSNAPPGSFSFAVYQWQLSGLKDDLELKVVCSDDRLGDSLLQLLSTAAADVSSSGSACLEEDRRELDAKHYAVWKEALELYRRRVAALAEFKEASLTASHASRRAILQDRLAVATDERILRMRQSEIDRAEREYRERRTIIQRSSEQADIAANRILSGTITVTPSDEPGDRHGSRL
ncbi:MAG TPA: helicase-related protein [Pirellulaceae bacterium]|jgi:superfamily II DNA or RNA helicase|nr:helicase-related protein [Pirellulaceae bacterium]